MAYQGGAHVFPRPAMGGRYQLTVRIVYNFQTLTPFIQQFLGSSTVYMIVTSTVTTEY